MLKQGFSHLAYPYIARLLGLSARAQRALLITALLVAATLFWLTDFDGTFVLVSVLLAMIFTGTGIKSLLGFTNPHDEASAKKDLHYGITILLALGLFGVGVITFISGVFGFMNGAERSIILLPIGFVVMAIGVVFGIISHNFNPD